MFESTDMRHHNDNISLLIPSLGLTQGTKPADGMPEQQHSKVIWLFLPPCLHSWDKEDFSLLFLTALSSTETSGGAKAAGKNPRVKGERSPLREMCTEMSRAELEGHAKLLLSSTCLWGNLQGTAGLARVTLIYSYGFQLSSQVPEGSKRQF